MAELVPGFYVKLYIKFYIKLRFFYLALLPRMSVRMHNK